MAKKKQPQKKKPATEMRKGRANQSKKSTGPDPDQEYVKATLLVSREIIESIVIAFVLAFLVRTFEVEAFVIPTGSMADTLVGRHKDVICPECKFPFRAGASSELDGDGGMVRWCTCPNCRYTMDVSEGNPAGKTYPSYSGDRILVGKFPFEPGIGEPKRFDVIVFKYPGNAKTNYIKRLVGLPNETILISGGDLFVKKKGDEDFTIAQKSPGKLRAMMRVVHDNDYLATKLVEKNWPARWQSFTESANAWNSDNQQIFQTNGAPNEELWLRYQHFVPKQRIWDNMERTKIFEPQNYVPIRIYDTTAYNSSSSDRDQEFLVGDLAIECELEVKNSQGHAIFEVVEDGRTFQCRFDLSSGTATLSIPGKPTAKTMVQGPGTYQVFFANADDKLYLWVNDEVVQFNVSTTYNPSALVDSLGNDFEPVGIASSGGAKLQVNHLRVHRDLYYIAPEEIGFVPELYSMGEDQFFVLGDNSARSADGRFWKKDKWDHGIGRTVDRKLLIGKALYIYWPHSFDRVTLFDKEFLFPFFPNYSKMKLVR